MSILVVGAGATGGYFGGPLAQAGRDVTFLVRERRAAALRERGLRIVGPGGTEVIEPRLATSVSANPDAGSEAGTGFGAGASTGSSTGSSTGAGGAVDVVLVTVKADGLGAVIPEIRAAVGPGTAVVPVLNGIRHLGLLNDAFGRSRVLGGVAVVSTQLDGDGDIRQLNDMASLTIGAQDGQRTPAVDRTSDLLSGAGFPVSVSDDIVAAMWQKWGFIASAGALNCLLGGSVGEIVAVEGGDDLARAILEE